MMLGLLIRFARPLCWGLVALTIMGVLWLRHVHAARADMAADSREDLQEWHTRLAAELALEQRRQWLRVSDEDGEILLATCSEAVGSEDLYEHAGRRGSVPADVEAFAPGAQDEHEAGMPQGGP